MLGSFRVIVDGIPVEDSRWTRRQPKQMVKLLALQPHARLHREQAMEFLWPEEDQESASNNLHRTIHLARRALEPRLKTGADSRFILTREEQLLLRSPGRLWIDAHIFERKAIDALKSNEPADYEAALSLYQDDLLAEDPYEDWAARPRERLFDLWRNLLVRLAAILETQRHYDRGIEYLKKVLIRNLSDEEAHRHLMRLYALSGSKNKALAQYRLCCEAVRKELDAEPEEATVKLYQQILSGQMRPLSTIEARETPTIFRQLTFRRGSIHQARFVPGSQKIIYSAAWEGRPYEIFETQVECPDSHSLGFEGASILAASSTGEMLLLLRRRMVRGYVRAGTLARLPLSGERLQEILDDVHWADWANDGAELTVVRDQAGRNCLEFPVGKVLYETGGWISHPRISPNRDRIAFLNHPVAADDAGSVMIFTVRTQELKTLSEDWLSIQGLAWSPEGNEVWFTATKTGINRALYAATLSGEQRLIKRGALSTMTLQDISNDGRVLLTRDSTRLGFMVKAQGEQRERDLSWHDWSLARDISSDGKTILFTETGEGGGATYGVYLRRMDGSPAVRLGDGSAMALSPDGQWALARLPGTPTQLALLPTGGSEARLLERAEINYHPWASWFPEGERILFAGYEAGHGSRLYVQAVGGGAPYAITPEGVHLTTPHAVSPDGTQVVALGPNQQVNFYSVEGGAAHPVPDLVPGEVPVRWSADASWLYIYQRMEVPAMLSRIELTTGRREECRELMPADPAGITEILRVLLTPDAEAYAYTYTRDLSDLYLVTGLI